MIEPHYCDLNCTKMFHNAFWCEQCLHASRSQFNVEPEIQIEHNDCVDHLNVVQIGWCSPTDNK